MKKSELMRSAHRIAKGLVQFTEDYSIALSYALKEVWRQVKLYDKKRFGDTAIMNAVERLSTTKEERKKMNFPATVNTVEFNNQRYGVPEWIAYQNLNEHELYAVRVADEGFVSYETEKAIKIAFMSDYGTVKMWCPKSVLVA